MKRSFIYLAMPLVAVSCANDSVIDTDNPMVGSQQVAIGFSASQNNTTRATSLQTFGRYNFGVFGYKNTDDVHPVIENYLVGYFDDANKKGYYMTVQDQTTLGDKTETVDGQSYWAYEKLGSADYTYSGTEGYFKATETSFMSNHPNQYLRYWDYASATTNFYAYSPYINGANTATFSNATKVLTIPDGSLTDGYDLPSLYEYMWASASVNNADYAKDVKLAFKRLNAKVNIKFWEDIAGYSVKIVDLFDGKYNDVQATPAVLSGSTYSNGTYYKQSGYTLDFSSSVAAPTITQAAGTTVTNSTPLIFKEPVEDEIGTDKATASASPTTYFAIPKNNTTGFTFHVSFVLTSTTGEKILVKNATVHVPADKCNWKANNVYTYIFKITKNTTGSTDPKDDSSIDPTNPAVNPEKALYPIVFDGANVEDWTPIESDHTIS